MQRKSLLTKAQEAAVAEAPGPGASEMNLGLATAGDGRLAKLMGGPPPAAPYVSAGSATPYLFFYYGIGEGAEAAKKSIPSLRKGDLVLVANGAYAVLRSPLTVFFCTAAQHWAERVPATQQILRASLEPQGRGSPLKEEVEALVLVSTGDGLVPATWRTKGAACRGPVRALQELVRASTAEWLAQSEGHTVTAQLPTPWSRFVAEFDYDLETGRNGQEYVKTGVVCRPVDPDAFARLRNFLGVAANQLRLGEAFAEHERKLDEVKAKLAA
jgi:hypothetical protein